MVELRILSGKKAGTTHTCDRIPCLIGRSSGADLCLEEAGVWDRHCELTLESGRFVLKAFPNASLVIDGSRVERAVLKNGDLIEAGAAKLQFWLAPTRQRSLRAREAITWVGFGAVCFGQIYLVYRLLQ